MLLQAYQDRLDYWYPAIRFRKEDDISKALRIKEKSDWKTLSAEDKKTRKLYMNIKLGAGFIFTSKAFFL